MTVRMFCEPVLRIDMDRVRVALDEEMAERAALIEASGQPIAVLSSAAKFAAALEELGVEVPTKVSVRTDQETYAFAKSDLEFTELKQHPDERVRRLVAGRLAAKSTIGETRAVRFLQAGANGNRLPVLLQYYRAHTGRWSAGNKMNLQNLKRKGELRRSILAPEGHVIAVADSAQIEVRMLAWLARDQELLEIFTSGADPYKHMAAQIYGKPIDQITKDERFIGKIAVLGLGYGMGWQKFRDTLAAGAMGPPVQIDDHEAQRIVRTYRAARSAIVRLWRDMDALLAALATRREMALGPLKSDGECRVWLPNGLYLQYPFIRGDVDEDGRLTNFRYFDYSDGMAIATNRKLESDVEVKRIYGGLMTENVVQALARIVVGEQMLIIDRRLKDAIRNEITNTFGRVVTMTHDEVVCVVPAQRADELSQMMIDEMSVAPLWCQGVTLSAEGGYDVNYSK
jgi:DNA polymerase